jgi:hypothetical protein
MGHSSPSIVEVPAHLPGAQRSALGPATLTAKDPDVVIAGRPDWFGLVCQSSGDPVPGATIAVLRREILGDFSPLDAEVRSDGTGRFSITATALPPGCYRILIQHPDFAPVERSVQLSASGPWDLGRWVFESPGWSVLVEVIDGHGAAVPAALVSGAVPVATGGYMKFGPYRTDTSGRLRLQGLPLEVLQLSAWGPKQQHGEAYFAPSGGAQDSVVLRLEEAPSRWIELARASDGLPAEGVSIFDRFGYALAQTDAAGRCRIAVSRRPNVFSAYSVRDGRFVERMLALEAIPEGQDVEAVNPQRFLLDDQVGYAIRIRCPAELLGAGLTDIGSEAPAVQFVQSTGSTVIQRIAAVEHEGPSDFLATATGFHPNPKFKVQALVEFRGAASARGLAAPLSADGSGQIPVLELTLGWPVSLEVLDESGLPRDDVEVLCTPIALRGQGAEGGPQDFIQLLGSTKSSNPLALPPMGPGERLEVLLCGQDGSRGLVALIASESPQQVRLARIHHREPLAGRVEVPAGQPLPGNSLSSTALGMVYARSIAESDPGLDLGSEYSTFLAPDGSFRFDALPRGEYRVHAMLLAPHDPQSWVQFPGRPGRFKSGQLDCLLSER